METILNKEFADAMLAAAKANLEASDGLIPVVFLLTEDGEMHIEPVEDLPASQEMRYMKMLEIGYKAVMAGWRVKEAAFIAEAWVMTLKPGQEIEGRVKDQPESVEAITFYARGHDADVASAAAIPYRKVGDTYQYGTPILEDYAKRLAEPSHHTIDGIFDVVGYARTQKYSN